MFDIQALGEECFPDDPVVWSARSVSERGGYHFVEAVAEPATVGYPAFLLVVRVEGDRAGVAGGYCWTGRWQLLFSDPAYPTDWKAIPVNP
ncbi:MAG: hypothetical protein AB1758_37855 [Candidatus Eremiobacterota bacterium]